ncbi:MAG: substrate-binding domain-containing protein [Aminipila sp.]
MYDKYKNWNYSLYNSGLIEFNQKGKVVMKKVMVALLVAILVFVLIGCGNGDKKDEEQEIMAKMGIIVSDLSNPFYADLIKGAEAKAEELDVKLIVFDSKMDSAMELSNMQEAISEKLDFILINPVAAGMAENSVASANKAEIPIITINTPVEEGKIQCHINSNNADAGQLVGEYLIKKLGGEGVVAEIKGNATEKAAKDKSKGLNKTLKESNIKVIEAEATSFNRSQGFSAVQSLLKEEPKISAVFAHDDELALGALEAVKLAGSNTLVIGFGGSNEAINSIKNGELTATVQKLPKEMGAAAVESAMKVLDGKDIDKVVSVEFYLRTE